MGNIEKIKELIASSDKILIGAGAGLSAAAGFEYGGKTFMDNFAYMYNLYGYTDMYSAGFHPFDTNLEKWAYWAKFIKLNRYSGVKMLYKDLYKLVGAKDYFVLTTNVDHQFQLAGFDKKRLFYTQGDYGLFQCSVPCHNKTYDNEKIINEMVLKEKNHKIPENLVPRCPVCGKEMETNLRSDDNFVEDEGWRKALNNYQNYMKEAKNKKVLLFELGVGYNTPVIIKYPFWRFTKENKNAFYVSVNLDDDYVPTEIKERSISLNMNIKDLIRLLLEK